MMKLRFRFSAIVVDRLLTGIVLALVLTVALAVWLSPAPRLLIEHGGATTEIFADKAWSLSPDDCIRIRLEHGVKLPIHIDGREWHESGEQQFCPQIFAPSPKIELTDHRNGVYLSPSLKIYYAPDVVVNVLGLAALGFFPLLALYYLWSNDLSRRPSLRMILLAMLAVLLAIALFRLSGRALTIVGILAIARNLFARPSWHIFGTLITAAVLAPLALHSIRQGIKSRNIADFTATGCFFLFIGLLYLPFGLDTIGHWEEWTNFSYFEGLEHSRLQTELSQRYWILSPNAAAYLINSETFFGYNAFFALLLWGKLALFYSILRHYRLRSWQAFLLTLLFAVYPVDSGLLYLRAIPVQFNALILLSAVYLALQYRQRPMRSYLIGIFAMMALCVGTYEAQYALILTLPMLWIRHLRRPGWSAVNLTVIWYLLPALKLVYIFLLAMTRRSFYRSHYIYAGTEVRADNLISSTIDNLLEVYHRTFVVGWGDALADLGQNNWMPLTLTMLALAAAVAWYLWRWDVERWEANERQLLVGLLAGLLLILAAVGVLIWFSYYNQGLWRLYLYVPGPAAIAVFCLIALVATRVSSSKYRDWCIIITCLTLIFPGISRLIQQHEHYVVSADNKKRIHQQIVQIAPEMASQTRVIVLSDMSDEKRLRRHIEELRSNAIGFMLFYINKSEFYRYGFMCPSVDSCSPITDWADHLSDTLVFLLNEDLSLELVREPATIFSEFRDLDYDVTRLYNPDAPLPQRAYTMLGLTQP